MRKQFIYYIGLILITLGACSPDEEWDDMYDELIEAEDASYALIADLESAPDSYTLASSDYDYSSNSDISTYSNFSADATAKDYMPEILYSLYYGEDEQTIDVTYTYYNGSLDYLDDLAAGVEYDYEVTLTTEDYDSDENTSWYDNFDLRDGYEYADADTRAEAIGAMLELNHDAVADTYYSVTYDYYDGSSGEATEIVVKTDGVWIMASVVVPDGVTVYTLGDDDYDEMGEDYGEPGYYNNFSSTINPDNYLPIFLAGMYPYASEGDIVAVVYAYYSSGMYTYADQYTYSGSEWEIYESTTQVTSTFMFNVATAKSNGVSYNDYSASYWELQSDAVYLSEITYTEITLTTEDYDLDDLTSYYDNFDLRDGKDYAVDEARAEAIGAMLETNYGAGADEYYLVTYDYYDGSNGEATELLMKTDDVWTIYPYEN